MRKYKFLSLTLWVCAFVLFSSNANAFLFPTMDLMVIPQKIIEAKKTIEQSKFIQKGVKIFGDVSNIMGSSKSSITKFITENTSRVQKQLESFQKESQLMEDAKKTYQEAQSIKKEYDKSVSDYNSYKSEAEKAVSTAKNTTVNDVVKDVTKGTVIEDATNAYSTAKETVDNVSENPTSILNSTSSSNKTYGETSEDDNSISGEMKKFRETVNNKVENAVSGNNSSNNTAASDKEEENKTEDSKEETTENTQASYSFNSPLMFAAQEEDDFFPYDKYEGAFFIPLIISERCKMQPQDFANEERTKECFLLFLENYKSEIQSIAQTGADELKLANYQMTMGIVAYALKKRIDFLDAPKQTLDPLDKQLSNSPDLRSDTQSIAVAAEKNIEYVTDGNDLLALKMVGDALHRIEGFDAQVAKRYRENRN